jgi:hypothetical protein
MPVWKATLKYRDAASGLGWSVTTYRADATAAAVFTAADTWNTKYMACCYDSVKVVELNVSDVAVFGDIAYTPGSVFATTQGQLHVGLVPLAEYLLVKGIGAPPGFGTSFFKLHGFDIGLLQPDGSVDHTNADIIALDVANDNWFRQYRAVATPVHALPAVNPPAAWAQTAIRGPYVKRLGTPFGLPGQRARH